MPVGETPTPDPDPIENRAPLSVSSLKYPTNNLLCINNTLDFEWEKATDPDGDNLSYIIEIAADNTFSSLIHNYTVSATSRTITLDKGEAFYWRVKAKDPKGLTSEYSSIFQFYTEGIGEENHLPFSPAITSPSLEGTVQGSTVDLKWTASDVDNDPLTFDILFDTSNPPVTKVGDNQSDTSLTVNLAANTKYYWQVIVKDDKGGQTLGQIWSFMSE